VRVRDHMLFSAAGAVLLRPWLGAGALSLAAGGVLIDADHYAWFCLHHRCLNPIAAVHFFNGPNPPHHPGTRALHTPLAMAVILSAGLRLPRLLPVTAGMGLHVALDAHHEARMRRARAAALERDGHSCRGCGSHAPDIETHIRRQPWLLPSYAAENVTSLCRRCHEAAHRPRRESSPWT
jgi:hypothetical protein